MKKKKKKKKATFDIDAALAQQTGEDGAADANEKENQEPAGDAEIDGKYAVKQ